MTASITPPTGVQAERARLLRFPSARPHDPAVQAWFEMRRGELGFYAGAQLEDPAGLLQGDGRYRRHVKLRPETDLDESALSALIRQSYALVRSAARASHGGRAA